ncbi:hypothetical protein EDB89DRAFT_1913176 [Lactarius sanguifluus]|nr:hypothetical protein EDB89DRAFT_1913176 [Lactarius sanguifluus]
MPEGVARLCPNPCVNSELGNDFNPPVPLRPGRVVPLSQTVHSKETTALAVTAALHYVKHQHLASKISEEIFLSAPDTQSTQSHGRSPRNGSASPPLESMTSARMVERCVVRARVLIRPLGPGLEIGTPRRASASACTRATDLHFHGQFVWGDIRCESDVAGAATAEPSAYCGGSESAVLGPLLARPGGWDALVPAPDDMQVAQVLFGKACSEHDWGRTNPRRPYKHLSYRYKEGWS